MNLEARKAQVKRTLRRIGWLYCALVCAAGTLGGVAGFLTRENDST